MLANDITVRSSRKASHCKSPFSSSFFPLSFLFHTKLLVTNSLSTKPLNQLQNDVTFAVVFALTVANWQEWQLWLATKFSTQHHYEMTKRSKVQTSFAHARSTCKHILCSFLRWLYLNFCQIIIWGLTTAKKNFCQPVLCLDLLWLCHQEAWLSFYDLQNIYPRNITEWQ